MKSFDYGLLTTMLRDLRHVDETMVLIDIASLREPECGEFGAVRVTATKSAITKSAAALNLEDAMLMVRAHLDEAIEARNKAAAEEAARAREAKKG